jgi:hypothetical protein
MNSHPLLFLFLSIAFTEKRGELLSKSALNTALLDDLKTIYSLSIDSLVYKANLKPQLNAIVFANYAPVINNFGYDTAISNGQNGSVELKDNWQKPKQSACCHHLIKGQSGH